MNRLNDIGGKFQTAVLSTIEPLERSESINSILKQVDDVSKSIRKMVAGDQAPGEDQDREEK